MFIKDGFMAINIVEEVQKKMGYEPLQKVDPNTQEPLTTETFTSPVSALAQAAIPAVLAAIYKKSKTPEDVDDIMRVRNSTNYLPNLFGDNADRAIQAVATYSKVTNTEAGSAMQQIAVTALQVLHTEVKDPTPAAVGNFMKGQRDNILHYLPASLQMGKQLDDDTIDDRTNKMEGPVSGLMHTIEKIFSDVK